MFASATKPSSFQTIDSLAQWFARITTALAAAMSAYHVYSRLSGLSNSQLEARGMTRQDITRATWQALEGHLF
ncbi:hypothetical protein [Pelagibius marinus]|uniref:hypothetical protein n=1 Tax=Pelagibius marinus TaxID=2762760 RepID=UPI0018733055|nr:hypothetical protein [Pelagibius marinus]